MEQSGAKWSSSILKGLGASSLSIPGENQGGKVKQYVAALALAAVAAMASFAPGVAHAADGPPQTIELSATYIYPDDVEPDPPQAGGSGLTDAQIAADNPFVEKYTIAERERDFIDSLDDKLNGDAKRFRNDPEAQAQAKAIAENNPITNSTAFKVVDAITSPLDAVVKYSTDDGSTANKYAGKAADVAGAAIKYSTLGPVVLVSDGIDGLKAGVASIADSRDREQAQAQAAVDASRERMARIYAEERARIAAEDKGPAITETASRVNQGTPGSSGLETSNDDLDVLFKAAPDKAAKHENSSLSR